MRAERRTDRPVPSRMLWLAAAASFLLGAIFLRQRIPDGLFGEDFTPSFWWPWFAIRSGADPYPDPSSPLADGSPFLYPPLAAELTLPLSWLSYDLAFAIVALALVAAAGLTLWALDVRLPEIWVVWMLSPAVIGPVVGGNVTPLVVLGVALTWRWRSRAVRASLALSAALVLKLFVWPVWFWLLFTGRFRAAAYTALITAALIAGSWAVIGFDSLREYPEILGSTSQELGTNGLLAYALLVKYMSASTALLATLAVATALLATSFMRRSNDVASLTLAIVACLYATPLIWVHYLGLLVIPAALYGGWMWATIPLLLVSRLAPVGAPRPAWMIACFVALTAAVVTRALARDRLETTQVAMSVAPQQASRASTAGPA